jgi:hypothetical protein
MRRSMVTGNEVTAPGSGWVGLTTRQHAPLRGSLSFRLGRAGILLLHVGLLAYGMTRQSPCGGEMLLIPSAVRLWQHGRFDLHRVNPPLVQLVVGWPLAVSGAVVEDRPYGERPGSRPEYQAALDFASRHKDQIMRFVTLARFLCLPLPVIGAMVCCLWARRLYGDAPALIALSLWSFSPFVLAHGQLVSTDMAAATLLLAASYSLWSWATHPCLLSAVRCGVVVGLALLAKFLCLVLVPLWLVVCASMVARIGQWSGSSRKLALQLCAGLLMATLVVDAGYAFRGMFVRLGDLEFVSRRLGGPAVTDHASAIAASNRFRRTAIGLVPLPVPADFVLGLDLQFRDLERGFLSYLGGKWSARGWWHYYAYGLAVKTPLGTLLLLALAMLAVAMPRYRTSSVGEFLVAAPSLAVLGLLSCHTGFGTHVRYALPCLPGAFICIGRLGRSWGLRHRCLWIVTVCLVCGSAISSLSVYPTSLGYFGALGGGVENGHRHLLHSNVDWGQDMLRLKQWAANHPTARPLHVACMGYVDPRYLGIDCASVVMCAFEPTLRPPALPAGWYAVSICAIYATDQGLDAFRDMQPIDRVGTTMYIYRLEQQRTSGERTAAAAARWRCHPVCGHYACPQRQEAALAALRSADTSRGFALTSSSAGARAAESERDVGRRYAFEGFLAICTPPRPYGVAVQSVRVVDVGVRAARYA